MISRLIYILKDVIKLVEKLTNSCIRFVHFSYDNENISKAFAEMLGLDTGWNCHISLGNDINMLKLNHQDMSTTDQNETHSIQNDTNTEKIKLVFQKKSNKFLKSSKSDLKTSGSIAMKTFKINSPKSKANNLNSRSLPSLKFSKYINFNTSLQIVKFKLPSSDKQKYKRNAGKKIDSTKFDRQIVYIVVEYFFIGVKRVAR